MEDITHIKSISQIFKMFLLAPEKHPLVAVLDMTTIDESGFEEAKFTTDFYCVMFKNYCLNNFKYGREFIDFQDGSLFCSAPGQVLAMDRQSDIEQRSDKMGWGLFFHPDLIRGTTLGSKFKSYHFFSYETAEALHLSDKEKNIMHECYLKIEKELEENIDDFSQDIIVANIEVMLNYCSRFYGRQFITRKASNHDVLAKMESMLNAYFEQELPLQHGLPTVEYLAGKLNFSARYLGDLLRSLTGQNVQQHIHAKLIEIAKEKLTSTNLSVSEIAYQLGFEHSQSFSKLFKKKTAVTPLEFKQSFN